MVENMVVIVLFIILCLYLIKTGYKAKVNKMLLFLVTKAETEFGSGTGKLKYNAVTTWIYERLPSVVTFLFTDKEIDSMIEDAVGDLKIYLESNSQIKKLVLKK